MAHCHPHHIDFAMQVLMLFLHQRSINMKKKYILIYIYMYYICINKKQPITNNTHRMDTTYFVIQCPSKILQIQVLQEQGWI